MPRDVYVGRAELADELGVTERSITDWVKQHEDFPSRVAGKNRTFPLTRCWRWYLQYKLAQKEPPKDLDEARVRFETAKAQLAELELEEAKGNLARKDQVQRVVRAMNERIRARLMALPSKAAPALVGMKRAVDLQVALEGYVEEVVGELREL